jgi:hypothetical protein
VPHSSSPCILLSSFDQAHRRVFFVNIAQICIVDPPIEDGKIRSIRENLDAFELAHR